MRAKTRVSDNELCLLIEVELTNKIKEQVYAIKKTKKLLEVIYRNSGQTKCTIGRKEYFGDNG